MCFIFYTSFMAHIGGSTVEEYGAHTRGGEKTAVFQQSFNHVDHIEALKICISNIIYGFSSETLEETCVRLLQECNLHLISLPSRRNC